MLCCLQNIHGICCKKNKDVYNYVMSNWTPEELHILYNYYPENGIELTCKKLGRPKTQVRPKLGVLGIKKDKNGWHNKRAIERTIAYSKSRIGTKRPEHSKIMKAKALNGELWMQINPYKKHGLSYTKAYTIWNGIIQRCCNPKCTGYRNYGGLGVKVCDDWKDVKTFCDWYNKELKRYKTDNNPTVERIDCFGNYTPSNCKLASFTEQARNKRKSALDENIVVEIKKLLGTMSQRDIAKKFNLNYKHISLIKTGRIWKE